MEAEDSFETLMMRKLHEELASASFEKLMSPDYELIDTRILGEWFNIDDLKVIDTSRIDDLLDRMLATLKDKVQSFIKNERTSDEERAYLQQNGESIVATVIRKYERAVKAIPYIKIAAMFSLAARDNTPITLNPEIIEKIRESTKSLGADDLSSSEQLVGLTATADVLGVFLRGHVMLENVLDKCINERLIKSLDLYKDLAVFFEQKARLANALGVISDPECALLQRINSIRNKLAHIRSGAAPYKMTQSEQQRFWSEFTALSSMQGTAWSEYDSKGFTALKLMFVGLSIMLSHRATAIAGEHKLESLDVKIAPSSATRNRTALVVKLIVQAAPQTVVAFEDIGLPAPTDNDDNTRKNVSG